MPELPEVETIARGLHKRVAGDTIESVWLGEKPEPLKSPANEIAEVLEGSRIVQVRRVGKHIVFDLERAGKRKRKSIQCGQWIVHLGMTGRMQVTAPEAELAKHTHAVVKLASGREVRFVDPRRFGRLAVVRMDPQQSATGIRRSWRRASGVAGRALRDAISRAQDSHQERAAQPEAAERSGEYLRRRVSVPLRNTASAAGLLAHARTIDASCTRPCRKCCAKPLRWAARRSATMSMPTAKKGFSNCSIGCTVGRASRAWFAATPIKRVVIAGRSSHYCRRCQK